MANDGYNFQGQCVAPPQISKLLNGQPFGNGVLSSCTTPPFYPVSGIYCSYMTGLVDADGVPEYSTVQFPVQQCDQTKINAGDLGVTVEITGAVLLLALGLIAGLLS